MPIHKKSFFIFYLNNILFQKWIAQQAYKPISLLLLLVGLVKHKMYNGISLDIAETYIYTSLQLRSKAYKCNSILICYVTVSGSDLGVIQCWLTAVCGGVTTEEAHALISHLPSIYLLLIFVYWSIIRMKWITCLMTVYVFVRKKFILFYIHVRFHDVYRYMYLLMNFIEEHKCYKNTVYHDKRRH